MMQMLAGGGTDGVAMSGDEGVLTKLLGLLDASDPMFALVTPGGRWLQPRQRSRALSL